ncbi:leucine-rich repeat domain-containing protein [uncultured Clostridium sp.]|uniref:leucine-rich repeat domain-containing protein n=1 Tax=uncultured Clostridium sp. TaxID=59620 RepID=UPI0025F994BD|nr:leucine-rich repeat domain-containing protein [uncultured Clostridium sp.]
MKISLKLEYLKANNNIRDITPVKDLKVLRHLCMNNNEIEDISVLHDMPKLKELELMNNKISDISPIEDFYLLSLKLSGNNIFDISKLKYQFVLRTYDTWEYDSQYTGDLDLTNQEVTTEVENNNGTIEIDLLKRK